MSKIYEALNRAKERGEDQPGEPTPESGETETVTIPAELREVWNYYETLHSAIDKALKGVGGRTILFASSVEGEGTTTVLAEYATTMARSIDKGALIVDANLRTPSLHDVFGVSNDYGLADVIRDGTDPNRAIHTIIDRTLSLLPAGNISSSPTSLLTSGRITRFLDSVKEQYGTILIDAPPILPYAEALHLAATADGVVFVVESERTKREIVGRAKDSLSGAGANILGVVMNHRRFVIPEFLYRQL